MHSEAGQERVQFYTRYTERVKLWVYDINHICSANMYDSVPAHTHSFIHHGICLPISWWHTITEAVGSHSLWKNAIGSEKSPHNKSNKLANVPPGVPQEKHLRFEPKNSILMTSICPEFRRRLRLVLQFLYTKSSTVNSRLTMSANSNKNDYANYTRR